jgi:hypothetical protein
MALGGRRGTVGAAMLLICLLISWPLVLLNARVRPAGGRAADASRPPAAIGAFSVAPAPVARVRSGVASPFALANNILSSIENRYPSGSGGSHDFSGGGGGGSAGVSESARLAAARKGVTGALQQLPRPPRPDGLPALPITVSVSAPPTPTPPAVPLRRPATAVSWPCIHTAQRPVGQWVVVPEEVGTVAHIQKVGVGGVLIETKTQRSIPKVIYVRTSLRERPTHTRQCVLELGCDGMTPS